MGWIFCDGIFRDVLGGIYCDAGAIFRDGFLGIFRDGVASDLLLSFFSDDVCHCWAGLAAPVFGAADDAARGFHGYRLPLSAAMVASTALSNKQRLTHGL